MSDERDLTPEQEARVARLLADARADEPVPPEVAARLDRVLDGLKHEQITAPGREITPVIDLAARRRRRAATLLAAAAAVVVAGVGIGQVVGPDGGDDDNSSVSADEAAEGGGDSPDRALPSAGGPAMTEDELAALGAPTKINARSFAAEVRRLQDHPGVRSDAADGTTMNGEDLAAPSADFVCSTADYGSGKLLAVFYQGRPAVLAYRPATGDTQVVDLVQCGSGDVVRSITIPLP